MLLVGLQLTNNQDVLALRLLSSKSPVESLSNHWTTREIHDCDSSVSVFSAHRICPAQLAVTTISAKSPPPRAPRTTLFELPRSDVGSLASSHVVQPTFRRSTPTTSHLLPLKFGAYSPILELVNHL